MASDSDASGQALTYDCLAVEIGLRGLQPDETYELTFEDTGERRTLSGRELSAPMRIEIDEAPGSVLMLYRKSP